MQTERFEALPKAERRRLIRRAVVRPAGTAVLLLVAYFAVPMTDLQSASAFAGLVFGLTAVTVLCVWQIRKIVRAQYPALQGVEALALTLPAYLLSFATLYYLMSVDAPGDFNEPLSRIDSLYFTLVCFSTVGFGDIAAESEVARAVVSVQIVGNLILIAVGVRIITAAVRRGQARRQQASD
ncbi:potassium channel family protein [Rhodococcus tukisamuensis]|uniref:Ion channel n=1 Tax=Rhodococcus tukisamuensis TaxID=168276 RepID=A0A1G7EAJ2_9NOCA|nr:potassium channel family protein [Rhodococcus tukisamuensis]SDE60673.1 Ion channel [Rhodococcus tukisamuensis]